MKRIAFSLLFFIVTIPAFAGNAEHFRIDQEAIFCELEGIACKPVHGIALQYMEFNPGPTPGIPSFVWGCFFGIAGIIVVHAITDSTEESKKALKGCIINAVFLTGTNVLFYLLL